MAFTFTSSQFPVLDCAARPLHVMLRLTQRCPAKQHWSWFEETLSVSPGGSPTLTGLQCSHGEAHELTIYNVNSWLFDSVPIPRVLWQHRGGSFFTRHVCPLSPTHLVEVHAGRAWKLTWSLDNCKSCGEFGFKMPPWLQVLQFIAGAGLKASCILLLQAQGQRTEYFKEAVKANTLYKSSFSESQLIQLMHLQQQIDSSQNWCSWNSWIWLKCSQDPLWRLRKKNPTKHSYIV